MDIKRKFWSVCCLNCCFCQNFPGPARSWPIFSKEMFLVVDTINAPILQLVVNEVANKFAGSHFQRGVRERIVRHLTTIIIDYVQVSSISWIRILDIDYLK